jgi:NADPH:quinone reductase-like Zn-dependent oxidoreductase
MLQAVLKEPRKFEIREVSKSTLGDGDVLIKVRKLGICGSDIYISYGKHIYSDNISFIWRQLTPDGDTLAKEELKFLRTKTRRYISL